MVWIALFCATRFARFYVGTQIAEAEAQVAVAVNFRKTMQAAADLFDRQSELCRQEAAKEGRADWLAWTPPIVPDAERRAEVN